jgi:hypothetical protein
VPIHRHLGDDSGRRLIEMKQRDLLAELELTMVPSLEEQPEPGLYVPATERPDDAGGGSRRRRFWCAAREQDVEVEFETRRMLGFPRTVGVKRCSVFEEPDKVECGRHCLEARFRRQWPYALPVVDRRRRGFPG